MSARTKNIKLKRELGLWSTTLCGVGIILGAGIYALVGKAAGIAGDAVWLSFLIASVVAGLTGLSYAELSSRFPKAGAEYDYTKNAFGKRIAFIVGWLIFIGGSIAAAAVALGFAGYFAALFHTPIVIVAILLIIATSYIVYYGIKQSAWVAILFTLIEAGGLILIILLGLFFGNHEVDFLSMNNGFSGVLGAAALIFFAYIGFEEIARLSEETKDPEKNIPIALILSIIITTLLYIFVAIASISILGWQALGSSHAPLADVASAVLGPIGAILLSVIALFSTTNTVLLEILASARIVFGMGREGSLPKIFGSVHPQKRTPWVATMFVMFLAILFASLGDISVVAGITDFTIFLTFMVINLVVIMLRYTMPSKKGFKTPISIGRFPLLPLFGFITSALLLISLHKQVIFYGIAIMVLGIIAYECLKLRKYKR